MEKKRINQKTIELFFLLILVVSTFSVRFYNSGELSGGDDSEYAQLAMHIIENPSRAIYPSFPDEPTSYGGYKYNRPFAATPIVPFIFIFGYTNTAVKLPSIIFACLTVIVLYYLLKRQFNTKIAYLATILFAFLPFHIAFSRSGFLHSALTFYVVLTIFLVIKSIEENKPHYTYLAAFVCLVNLLTTDFRGILPILSLIPYIAIKIYFSAKTGLNNNKSPSQISRQLLCKYKHFIIATIIALFIYFLYMLLPWILWNDTSYLNWFKIILIHSLGINKAYMNYKPFTENILLMGKYLILTPFIGLIFIPLLFGLIYSLTKIVTLAKRVRNVHYLLWLSYLAVSLLYYINKQPYVERQTVFSPAYVTFAAIGIYIVYISFIRQNKLLLPLLIGLTTIYWIIILKFFPFLFSVDIKGNYVIETMLKTTNQYFYLFIMFIVFLAVILIIYISRTNLRKEQLRKIATIFIIIFLTINILSASFLVLSGVGIFKRPEEIKIVGDFLKKNTEGINYSCLAYNEDKSLTFYTQKICANYKIVNVSWIEKQVKNNNLKFFIFNLYQKKVGIGIETLADISKSYPAQYEWIMNNTIDVTEKTGLTANNPYFRVREYVNPS